MADFKSLSTLFLYSVMLLFSLLKALNLSFSEASSSSFFLSVSLRSARADSFFLISSVSLAMVLFNEPIFLSFFSTSWVILLLTSMCAFILSLSAAASFSILTTYDSLPFSSFSLRNNSFLRDSTVLFNCTILVSLFLISLLIKLFSFFSRSASFLTDSNFLISSFKL